VRRAAAATIGILCGAAGSTALAAERQHDAHQHGIGQLNIAVEAGTVRIELSAPGADIVGFEHMATNETERAALSNAAARLRDGAALFVFPAEAGCTLEASEVHSDLLTDAAPDAHAHDDAHEHEDEHGSSHEHAGSEDGHAEFTAGYRFECAERVRLTHVDVRVFEIFPASQRLAVQAISDTGQTRRALTPGDTRLDF
jgi:hypothetical protein